MNIKDAVAITGGLSNPGKMPCRSFNLPALTTCPMGRLLATLPNTSCSDCYALKGRFYFKNVKAALERRYRLVRKALRSDRARARWIDAMVLLIRQQSPDYFRWHDSGDIFSQDYLALMCAVIRVTPNTKHWIPTKEANLVTRNRELICALENACFRISIGALNIIDANFDLPTASVCKVKDYGSPESIRHFAKQNALLCLAKHRMRKQSAEQACGSCRACWDPRIHAVIYPLH